MRNEHFGRRISGLFLGTLTVTLGLFSPAWADQEQRAIQLGSTAKCSQTWNAPSILADGTNTFGWTPSVAPDKPCRFDANVQFMMNRPTSTPPRTASAATHPTVFSKLPAEHTNTYVLVMPEGYTGSVESGFNFNTLIRTQGRWSYRWYVYYSPNYSSYAYPAGPCTNSSKFSTIQPSYLQMTHQQDLKTPQVYGWAVPPDSLAWQPNVSPCCWEGPGYDRQAASDGALPGSWWRYELVGHGMNGTPGAYIKVYRKNVTTNSPERKIIDTTIPCADCGDNGFDWPTQAQTSLVSPANLSMVTSNFYRAGSCSGYIATAYALAAQWDTDAGQRIGSAVEIEGGGSSNNPAPPAPTNLRVTHLPTEELTASLESTVTE